MTLFIKKKIKKMMGTPLLLGSYSGTHNRHH